MKKWLYQNNRGHAKRKETNGKSNELNYSA